MIIAAHRPNFIPWLGFFDKMQKCNLFIIEDMVQFSYQDFQNLNRIKTPKFALSLGVSEEKNDLIIAQCMKVGADSYLSGVGGHNSLPLQCFEKNGIKVIFQNFKYPTYPQLWYGYIPNLSVVDCLFSTGSGFHLNNIRRQW